MKNMYTTMINYMYIPVIQRTKNYGYGISIVETPDKVLNYIGTQWKLSWVNNYLL